MGGAVGLSSGSDANGKANSPPDQSGKYEQGLYKIARDYYAQTAPARAALLDQGESILGGQSPATLPAVEGLLDAAKIESESAYAPARDRLIASTPEGGALSAALLGLEQSKAEDLASVRTQILSDAAQKVLAQLYGAAFGAPGVAASAMSPAAQAYASRYGSHAAAQASRYGSYIGGASQDYGNTTQMLSSMSSSCCFIFLAAEGHLDPVVRRYRDEHMTPRNRRGYYRISDWLVPKMKASRFVRALVKAAMVRPMTSYGRWFYGTGNVGILFAPVAWSWLRVFELLGWGRYIRANGEEV